DPPALTQRCRGSHAYSNTGALCIRSLTEVCSLVEAAHHCFQLSSNLGRQGRQRGRHQWPTSSALVKLSAVMEQTAEGCSGLVHVQALSISGCSVRLTCPTW